MENNKGDGLQYPVETKILRVDVQVCKRGRSLCTLQLSRWSPDNCECALGMFQLLPGEFRCCGKQFYSPSFHAGSELFDSSPLLRW